MHISYSYQPPIVQWRMKWRYLARGRASSLPSTHHAIYPSHPHLPSLPSRLLHDHAQTPQTSFLTKVNTFERSLPNDIIVCLFIVASFLRKKLQNCASSKTTPESSESREQKRWQRRQQAEHSNHVLNQKYRRAACTKLRI